jgi:hypothetical protein
MSNTITVFLVVNALFSTTMLVAVLIYEIHVIICPVSNVVSVCLSSHNCCVQGVAAYGNINCSEALPS